MISEFAKEKVFWTRKMNLKLVKFIEKRPHIWNPKHPKYTSVEHRDRTYAEFATKYGNEFTRQAVKDRWTNIRCTFAYYLRKMKASQARNDGEIYKVSWHLWDACSFLQNINKKIDTTNSIEYPEDELLPDSLNEDELDGDMSCQNIANGILNVFRGVQNDIFNVDDTEYGRLGQKISSVLSQMSSFEATEISNKIMDILTLFHEDNPHNPNNIKLEDTNH